MASKDTTDEIIECTKKLVESGEPPTLFTQFLDILGKIPENSNKLYILDDLQVVIFNLDNVRIELLLKYKISEQKPNVYRESNTIYVKLTHTTLAPFLIHLGCLLSTITINELEYTSKSSGNIVPQILGRTLKLPATLTYSSRYPIYYFLIDIDLSNVTYLKWNMPVLSSLNNFRDRFKILNRLNFKGHVNLDTKLPQAFSLNVEILEFDTNFRDMDKLNQFLDQFKEQYHFEILNITEDKYNFLNVILKNDLWRYDEGLK
jgi:hypothetical protein